jgi:hypothetical protein
MSRPRGCRALGRRILREMQLAPPWLEMKGGISAMMSRLAGAFSPHFLCGVAGVEPIGIGLSRLMCRSMSQFALSGSARTSCTSASSSREGSTSSPSCPGSRHTTGLPGASGGIAPLRKRHRDVSEPRGARTACRRCHPTQLSSRNRRQPCAAPIASPPHPTSHRSPHARPPGRGARPWG